MTEILIDRTRQPEVIAASDGSLWHSPVVIGGWSCWSRVRRSR